MTELQVQQFIAVHGYNVAGTITMAIALYVHRDKKDPLDWIILALILGVVWPLTVCYWGIKAIGHVAKWLDSDHEVLCPQCRKTHVQPKAMKWVIVAGVWVVMVGTLAVAYKVVR